MNAYFDYELDVNGRTLMVHVEADAHVYRDLYGADADGRRGEWRTEVDDLVVTIVDGRGKNITEKVAKRYKAEFESIEELALDKLVDSFNDEPEYEPDYD